ncbi:MAG: biotin--[acetyl-CoA-carboxylase] ligase [Sediminibacterium sp.]|nr:biotin--[acetyl-CoA-carboxylase] ligase [Sediminibacterium sp.]
MPLATPFNILGEPLIELPLVDSTNIYAMAQIKDGLAKSGSCFRADFQTHGKGQHGRVWESTKGQNLLCTYILELKQLDSLKKWSPTHQIGFSAAIALGIRSFFDGYTNGDTKIKRPNDIYWRDRKAGGILIENLVRGTEWTWSVVGIGININQTVFSPDAPNPVSLKQITGRDWEILSLQESLTKSLNASILEWQSNGDEKTMQQFDQHIIEFNSK